MKMLMWDETDKKYKEVIDVKDIKQLQEKIHNDLNVNGLLRFFQIKFDNYFNEILE